MARKHHPRTDTALRGVESTADADRDGSNALASREPRESPGWRGHLDHLALTRLQREHLMVKSVGMTGGSWHCTTSGAHPAAAAGPELRTLCIMLASSRATGMKISTNDSLKLYPALPDHTAPHNVLAGQVVQWI